MQFWFFDVVAKFEVELPNQFLVLEPGKNSFNGMIEDFDTFREELLSQGVTITRASRLDLDCVQEDSVPIRQFEVRIPKLLV